MRGRWGGPWAGRSDRSWTGAGLQVWRWRSRSFLGGGLTGETGDHPRLVSVGDAGAEHDRLTLRAGDDVAAGHRRPDRGPQVGRVTRRDVGPGPEVDRHVFGPGGHRLAGGV